MAVQFLLSRFPRMTAPVLLLFGMVAPGQAQAFKLTVVPDSNAARFIVRETFINVPTPVEPMGETKGISGEIVFDATGKLDPRQSKIIVALTTLKTDQPMRDEQIRVQGLETDKYPNAELALTTLTGLASPLPMNGALAFTLTGTLTMHGVTKPTTWTVTATAKNGKYTGIAKTTIRFDDFNITKPRGARVLSVVDEVRLEYSFSFVRQAVR